MVTEKEKERCREKYKRLGYSKYNRGEGKKKIDQKYKSLYPEKVRAKSAANRRHKVESGHQRHHWSYEARYHTCIFVLDIRGHKKLHSHLLYEPETMMYLSLPEKSLLDTKEKHRQHILNLGIEIIREH